MWGSHHVMTESVMAAKQFHFLFSCFCWC